LYKRRKIKLARRMRYTTKLYKECFLRKGIRIAIAIKLQIAADKKPTKARS